MKLKLLSLSGGLLAACLSAHAASVVVAAPGNDGAAVIQKAIDGLLPGRGFIGTVKPVGRFALEQGLLLPDYTRLDLSEARLVMADRVKASAILDVVNCSGDGIRLNGKGRHTRDVQLRNLRLIDNNRCGLNVMWAERNIFVSDIYAIGNKEVGIRSDHSEGLYQNICANANKGHGIFIRNIFGGTYNNLTATRNGGMGIHVQGMVCSRGSNWGAHNNSMENPGKHADIFFDADASLSYGITKMSVLSNITAGPYSEYGDATEKAAVEFGADVREGLKISNLLEL